MDFGLYEVVGKREYRGHKPGDRFEARLDRNAERRAIVRGDILLIRRIIPSIEGCAYTFPDGWLSGGADAASTEAPEGASLVLGGR